MKVHQLIALLQEFPQDHEVRFFDLFQNSEYTIHWDTTIEDVSLYPNEQSPLIMLKGRNICEQEMQKQINEITKTMDYQNLKQFLKQIFNWKMK